MPFVTCLCGARVDATDAAALSDAFLRHTDQSHADIDVPAVRRRDIAESIRRTGGYDGQRLTPGGEVTVRPLAPELADDYLDFFDNRAFPDNPVWASCYCISYNVDMPPLEFERRGAQQNRADRAEMIRRGEASGVLAYAGDRVIGWCHAAPRVTLRLLDRTPEFASDDPDRTGAIVCYVIAPQYRGQGLPRRLLDGACETFRDRGFSAVDAYPPRKPPTPAAAYHGRLQMYLDAGFEQLRDAGRYIVVRKTL